MKDLNRFEIYGAQSHSTIDQHKDGTKPERIKEVLIVDDEEPLLLTIAEGLSIYKKYFNLLTATNGADAVKLLKSSPVIDLVVTDLSMPKMDGFELLAYMNRNYPQIPVILMTAFGTPKIEEIVNSMGLFRYLEKPLDINSIAENILAALDIQPGPDATGTRHLQNRGPDGLDHVTGGIVANYYKKTMP